MPSQRALLPRSTPAAVGVSARAVAALLDRLEARSVECHSIMVVRHGHVVAEGWWAPYSADRPHLLYSLTKSFTSVAVGLAIADGLLSLDDRVVDVLPEHVPADVSEQATPPHRAPPAVHDGRARHGQPRRGLAAGAGRPGARASCAYRLPKPREHGTPTTTRPPSSWPGWWNGSRAAACRSCSTSASSGRWASTTPSGTGWRAVPPSGSTGCTSRPRPSPPSASCCCAAASGATGSWSRANGWSSRPGGTSRRCRPRTDVGGRRLPVRLRVPVLDVAARYHGNGAFGQQCMVVPSHDLVVAVTGATDDRRPGRARRHLGVPAARRVRRRRRQRPGRRDPRRAAAAAVAPAGAGLGRAGPFRHGEARRLRRGFGTARRDHGGRRSGGRWLAPATRVVPRHRGRPRRVAGELAARPPGRRGRRLAGRARSSPTSTSSPPRTGSGWWSTPVRGQRWRRGAPCP